MHSSSRSFPLSSPTKKIYNREFCKVKITFLGTSHGVPEADRNCSSAMIEIGESIYLIDAGAPVSEELRKRGKDFNAVRAIFTTHAHGDHTMGLIPFSVLSTWYFKKVSVDIYLTEQELIDGIKNLMGKGMHMPLREEGVRYHTFGEGKVYEDENIRVTAIPTKHCLPRPSYALLVESCGKRVLFSGDISFHMREDDMPKEAFGEPLDAFILELAHNEITHLRPYLERITAKKLYFNHISPTKFEGVYAAREDFAYPVEFLSDGDVLKI